MSASPAERTAPVPLWIAGASGLLTGELLRLLEGHDSLRLAGLFARQPEELRGMHPHLSSSADVHASSEAAERLKQSLAREAGPLALVLGMPHGESARFWSHLRQEIGTDAERIRVVDLSADYRLQDTADYRRWYGAEHPDPEELERFVYGLPERTRGRLVETRRAAAPGCFATALQLATLPLAQKGCLDPKQPWSYFAVTGSSGSGNRAKATTHHPHRNGNFWAYALGGHRHEAELAQSLNALGLKPHVNFMPHSGPFSRGIHLTALLPLAIGSSAEDVHDAFRVYADEPFVEVLESGVPDLRRVAGSNRVALASDVQGERVRVLLTLDNTVKGGAGQALQCLNLMLGFPEGRGLPRAGIGIV